jgi:hypothetical protein
MNEEGVFVPAFPAVLRAGLPVFVDQKEWIYVGTTTDGTHQFSQVSPGVLPSRMVADSFITAYLDLRNPTVRDAVVRAIWHKLHPKEPDPLTAPAFLLHMESLRLWRLCWHAYPVCGRSSARLHQGAIFHFEPSVGPGGRAQEVPALATIPLDSLDRDLLALAEVAKVVLA